MQVVQIALTLFEGKGSLGRNATASQASGSTTGLLPEFQASSWGLLVWFVGFAFFF